MVRSDPAVAARALARDLHAELAIGGEATEAALRRIQSRQLGGADLDTLAEAMRRADAVRDRTRAAALERLAQRLNTTLAIHPNTIRRAAEEHLAAEAALTAAIAAAEQRTRRSGRLRAGGGGMAATGAAIGLLGLPPVGAAVAVAGALGAGASWFRHRRRPHDLLDARRADRDLARHRWEQVAGAGADPRAVDDLIHRYDPQHRVVAALVGESPAVRAADWVARERRMAWVAAWRKEVGDHAPVADPALHDLLQRDRTELWLTPDPLRALDEPDTLVVAAPYADLPDDRARQLHLRLLGLPQGQRVIVVLAPDPAAPTGAQVPGIGWVPAISPPTVPGTTRPASASRFPAGAS